MPFQLRLHLYFMDSLTHLVLGAAIGELVLGKKIGNRALIWGAIGETIPDLDVFGNFFLDPIDSLGFHRGFTHSILFSLIAPLIFAGLVYKLYHTDKHKSKVYKIIISILNIALIASIIWILNFAFTTDHHPIWWLLMLSIVAGGYMGWRLYKYYMLKDLESPKTSFSRWYLLFFLTFFTHIMLDSCTTYGTQLFLPFSNLRVAFNNIAVADLFFTIPFLICAIIFPFFKRGSGKRAFFNWVGISYAGIYMVLTIANKIQMDQVFDKALHHRGIEVSRCRMTPTILNNFLWSGVAEDENSYYVGLYSIFDSDPNFHYLNIIPKHDSIREAYAPNKDYQTLLWFSDGYLAEYPSDTMTVLTDLRYGGLTDTITGYHDMVFNFFAKEKNGELEFTENHDSPQGSFGDMLKKFIIRIKGY